VLFAIFSPVFDLISVVTSQELMAGTYIAQNDLLSVECDVRPELNQSVLTTALLVLCSREAAVCG